MHRPLALALSVLALLAMVAASGCASQATVTRTDGSTAYGTLVHADDDIVVLRKAKLVAPRNVPAPFVNRRGRPVWVQRAPEVAIPRDDVVRLTAVNRRARNAGIAGSVITGVSLFVLIPSAVAYEAAGGASCPEGLIFGGCDGERAGIGVGSILLIAGLVTGITGWVVYASSYRDEAGDVVPLAPVTGDAGVIRF